MSRLLASKTGWMLALLWLAAFVIVSVKCDSGGIGDDICLRTPGESFHGTIDDYLLAPGLAPTYLMLLHVTVVIVSFSENRHPGVFHAYESFLIYASVVMAFIVMYLVGFVIEKLIRKAFLSRKPV